MTRGRRLRILLTEGSSLSARQTLYALGPSRPVIDVCDPRPLLCLARFSRYVRACYRCPSFAKDPAGYLRFLFHRLRTDRYDVLLPTHDQVYLLARFRDNLAGRVRVALPAFEAVERLQSKAEFTRLLDDLGLPHPPTTFARSREELERVADCPCYVKLAYSTAGCGVWSVRDPAGLRQVADRLEREGFLDGRHEILVQQPASGVLGVVQSVFQHGRLVAAHCYQARALGVGGSARARIGVSHPTVVEHLARLGARLNWHGALMLDYLYDPARSQPTYIDSSPRIGETFNATRSGVNLCDLLVRVSLGEDVDSPPSTRPGVQTHSVMMSLVALAAQRGKRGHLLAELARAWAGRGVYAHGEDELTRPRDDPPSLLPAAFVTGQLLLNPRAAERIVRRTVDNYGLDERAVLAIGGMSALPADS
jgi:hypothetical protein